MDTAAELGRNPVSKHQIQSEYGDEQADADREILIFSIQLTTCRIGNRTRLIHTLAIYVTIHVCDHTIPILAVATTSRPNHANHNDRHRFFRGGEGGVIILYPFGDSKRG